MIRESGTPFMTNRVMTAVGGITRFAIILIYEWPLLLAIAAIVSLFFISPYLTTIHRYPEDLRLLHIIATAYRQKNLQRAYELTKIFFDKYPNSIYTRSVIEDFYLPVLKHKIEKGEFVTADYADFEKYIDRSLKNPHVDLDKLYSSIQAVARKASKEKDFALASQFYNFVYQRNKDLSILLDIAQCHYLAGQTPEEKFSHFVKAESLMMDYIKNSLTDDDKAYAMLKRAKAFEDINRYHQAIVIIKQAKRQFPNTRFLPEIALHKGRLYLKLANFEKAKQEFETLLENPEFATEANFYLGEVYRLNNDARCISKFRSVIEKRDKRLSPVANICLGVFYATENRPEALDYFHSGFQTLSDLNTLVDLNQDFASIYQVLKNLLQFTQEPEQIDKWLDIFAEIQRIVPDQPEHYFLRGQIFLTKARKVDITQKRAEALKNAISEFQKMFEIAPSQEDKNKALFHIAQTYVELGEFIKAAEFFNRYYVGSKDLESLFSMAEKLYEARIYTSKDPPGSQEYFKIFLQTAPQDHPKLKDAMLKIANIYFETGRYQEAFNSFNQIISDSQQRFTAGPTDKTWIEALFGQAISAFYLSKSHQQPELRQVFEVMSLQGFEEFLQRYANIIDKDDTLIPYCMQANYYLGLLFTKHRSYPQASLFINNALGLGEKIIHKLTPFERSLFEEAYFILPEIYYLSNDFHKAVEASENAQKKFPESKLLLKALLAKIKANIKLGLIDEARADFAKAITLYEEIKKNASLYDQIPVPIKTQWQIDMDYIRGQLQT